MFDPILALAAKTFNRTYKTSSISDLKNNWNFRIFYTLFQIKIKNGLYKGTLEKERHCHS